MGFASYAETEGEKIVDLQLNISARSFHIVSNKLQCCLRYIEYISKKIGAIMPKLVYNNVNCCIKFVCSLRYI